MAATLRPYRFIVMSKDRIQSVIYTFWMAGIVHLLVLTLHSQIMNHIGDFQSSNSYEKIQNDIGLLHNLYNALEIRSDVSTSPFIQQNFNKTLFYLKTQLEEEKLSSASNSTSPLRTILVSSWGSGSSLVADVLSSAMPTYYHYEPPNHSTVGQMNQENSAEEERVEWRLRNQLLCKNVTTNHLHPWYMKMTNPLVWKACWRTAFGNQKLTNKICSDAYVLDSSCALFPMQLMKVQYSRLKAIQSLLQDSQLNQTKIVLVVRDPRATINSRLSAGSIRWSHQQIDRNNSVQLCNDLNNDLDEYAQLSRLYPDRVILIKYESLIVAPQVTFKSLFDFVGFPLTMAVQQKIANATRDSLNYVPFTGDRTVMLRHADRWRRVLSQKQIDLIENDCDVVLKRLEYPLNATLS